MDQASPKQRRTYTLNFLLSVVIIVAIVSGGLVYYWENWQHSFVVENLKSSGCKFVPFEQ